LGGNAKYLTRNTDLDGVGVSSGRGWGLDLGVLATPWKGLRLGLVGRDVFDTKIDFEEGSSTAYPRSTRLAASYAFGSRGVVGLDIDDRYHLGGEVRFFDMLALRVGMEVDRDGDEDPQYSLGAGFELGMFRLDYAYVAHPVLEATNYFGLSMAFSFNPSRIRIEEVKSRDLYMSLYKSYAREPFGTVTVKNLDDEPLSAKLHVLVPGVMESASEQAIMVRPKATQEFPLTAVFPEAVMAQAGDRPVEVQVSATYQSKRLLRTDKGATRCVAYGPGAIDWGEGISQIAAFITTQDPMVDALARDACQAVASKQDHVLGNRNITFSAAIFDALGTLGVAYVPDPHNPYSSMSETPHAVDTVHYPRQTLETLSGDCDDTSVLMAALLGNVGIATKIVDVPGHVFVMFDTGIHERNHLALGLDEDLYVTSDGGVWIPIETTAIDEGFSEAWKIGAESYSSWTSRGRAELVDVTLSQQRYEPSEPPGGILGNVSLDVASLSEMVDRDAGAVALWRETHLASRYGGIDADLEVSPNALNELAHVYFLAGRPEEARAKLEEVLSRNPESAAAHNNLAATYVAQGDIDDALRHCGEANRIDPSDPGIWLNMGLIEHASGDTVGGEQALARGIALSGGYAPACDLLGLAAAGNESVGAPQRMSEEEARLLLKSAVKRIPEVDQSKQVEATPPVAEPPVSEPPPPVKEPPDSKEPQVRVAGIRAGEEMGLEDILYWKE
jgi:tetratricopeptide (TPR) repeat protein